MNPSKFESLKISTRLATGFILLLVFTVIMGGMALLTIANLSELMLKFSDHPFQVTYQAHRARGNILEMDRDMGDLLHASRLETVVKKMDRLRELDRQSREHLAVVKEFYLGPKEDVVRLSTTLDSLRSLREQAIALKRAGRDAEALALIRPEGKEIELNPEREIWVILDFAREKAASLRAEALRESQLAVYSLLATMLGLLVLGLFSARYISLGITRPLEVLRQRMAELAAGDLGVAVPFREGRNELAAIARTVQVFKEAALRLEGQRWVKSSVGELNTAMQSSGSTEAFAQALIDGLVPLCDAGVGIFYHANEAGDSFELLASYGLKKRRGLHTCFKLGEGLVGQAALEHKPILLTEVPDDYARITTGIGEAAPRQILVAPVLSKGRVLAVIELGSFHAFDGDKEALVDEVLPTIALNLEILQRNQRTEELLDRTQQQAEELRASEEELRAQSDQLQANNEELRVKGQSLLEQAEELRASEEELRAQREELQATNEELAEKGRGLEEQAVLLEKAKADAEQRALERDTASRYKSEFLSNMSHELRTPLNSLLILARSLRDNDEGNLSEDQVESAGIIHDSGTTLLRLINDILDLSKVEAGKMQVSIGEIPLNDFMESLRKRFRLLAESKGLTLNISLASDLPSSLSSDAGKLEQILNNLVGNAIKFTEQGSVGIALRPASVEHIGVLKGATGEAIAIEVSDTGIGIPADKIDSVFNAFEQVDGSASRRYGGTGLGLAISRRLAQLLGGEVLAASTEGEGSRFTLVLPLTAPTQAVVASVQLPARTARTTAKPDTETIPVNLPAPAPSMPAIADDRDNLSPKDETILIIEDDDAFARIVRDLSRRRGFKCLVANNGLIGLELARRYLPTGIVLDIGLPGLDGWSVMESLKQHPATRHIPVHFMSATDSSQRGLEMGAVGYLTKPVSREQIEGAFERIRHFGSASPRRLLLVEDDAGTRKAVSIMLNDANIEIVEESTGEGALKRLRQGENFDCMILDLGLPGIGGVTLLEQCTREQLAVPPVVVYSGRELSNEDTLALKEYTDSIVIKGARSPERLQDEVTLFLHSVQTRLPASQRKAEVAEDTAATELQGRHVLVVDDDMRNAFALSKVLRGKGLKVLMAQDGHKALAQLEISPEIDVVLMDIMMPGMDGYTAIREIRNQERFRNLPIIALTAKAMVGDRDKCIEAGANDYLSKPVDIDALLVKLREQLVAP